MKEWECVAGTGFQVGKRRCRWNTEPATDSVPVASKVTITHSSYTLQCIALWPPQNVQGRYMYVFYLGKNSAYTCMWHMIYTCTYIYTVLTVRVSFLRFD